ncbi:phosphatidylserine decarboxylase proenzyme, mitochondrial-like [Antedon mediterranea]|uniref:phosphatidylserine decarboxylase proenzyme, mitochondrial-like n=1 Tax=Antedon mediterranea TaxID=105859 RepID=UPI003AF98FE9
MRNYLRNLKWFPIPLSVGFGYICYQQYFHIKKRELRHVYEAEIPEDLLLKNWQVTLYRTLPLRTVSRCWGSVNSLEVPVFLRKPMYGLYSTLFKVNIEEAENPDLASYNHLQAFFTRNLKPNVREISSKELTSPCDGRVLYHGKVENSQVEQIKGVSYSLKMFLGPNSWNNNSNTVSHEATDEKYHLSLGVKPGNELYHVVIYLAPGDYHQFHSPADWTVVHRRHFPGDLFSVNPGVAKIIKGLFNYNERVVLMGNWKHGLFSMTAVGATNVGSIDINFDKDLKTNCRGRYKKGDFKDNSFISNTNDKSQSGVGLKKGEVCGKFNLGSTIVLIFEAPCNFQFNVNPGQVVKLGEQLGNL